MKILFITRKYPPQVGGMEKYSYELIKNFPGQNKLIKLSKSQKHLLWFLPYSLFKGIFLSKNVDAIYLCDGLLAPVGFLIGKISKKPVFATIHGLDVTYNNLFYQKFIIPFIKKLNHLIAVSNNTLLECQKRNIHNCTFIPNGIEIDTSNNFLSKEELSSKINIDLKNKKILFTCGRLVKRKGHEWFIKNIIPQLNNDIIYLIAGDGPELDNIKKTISRLNLFNTVKLVGRIDSQTLRSLYKISDIFIMPNILVENDIEGFGLVALEASSFGLPVLASNIQGIKDAIINYKNGILIPHNQPKDYIKEINNILSTPTNQMREDFKSFTKNNYSWEKIIKFYLNTVNNVISKL